MRYKRHENDTQIAEEGLLLFTRLHLLVCHYSLFSFLTSADLHHPATAHVFTNVFCTLSIALQRIDLKAASRIRSFRAFIYHIATFASRFFQLPQNFHYLLSPTFFAPSLQYHINTP